MFDAARAALLHDDGFAALPKTHSGLLSRFSEKLVLPGLLPKGLGRDLKRAEEIRTVADYTDDPIDASVGKQIVEQAEAFIAGISQFLGQ